MLYIQSSISQAVMAEWLRRLTRNQMGSSRAGSNPADCEFFSASEIDQNLERSNQLFFTQPGRN